MYSLKGREEKKACYLTNELNKAKTKIKNVLFTSFDLIHLNDSSIFFSKSNCCGESVRNCHIILKFYGYLKKFILFTYF